MEPVFSVGGRNYQFAVIKDPFVVQRDTGIGEVWVAQFALSLIASSTDILLEVDHVGTWLLNRDALLPNEFSISHPSQIQPEDIDLGPFLSNEPSFGAFAPVPEPSTALLASMAVALRLLSRRRR